MELANTRGVRHPFSDGYRLEFASGVWRQIGSLDRRVFDEILTALRSLAAVAPQTARARRAEGTLFGVPQKQSVVVGDHVAVYDLDHDEQMLLVLDIVRRPAETP